MKTISLSNPVIHGAQFILWEGRTAISELRNTHKADGNRHPHHTASSPHALLGAARFTLEKVLRIQPGEILLAGNSALILEDLPEFKRSAVEMVARAWRNGYVHLHAIRDAHRERGDSGTKTIVEIPVRCSIYATAQPCPCGLLDNITRAKECACSPELLARWRKRISDAVKLFRGVS